MIIGPLLAWIQKLAGQHFTLEVYNLITKAKTFTCFYRRLLVMPRATFLKVIYTDLIITIDSGFAFAFLGVNEPYGFLYFYSECESDFFFDLYPLKYRLEQCISL